MSPETLADLVRRRSAQVPTRPALLDVDGGVTTWADLAATLDAWSARIQRLGLAGDDRIAVSLPNGTGMATTFLGVAAHAICAPLNPGYTRTEAAFYLDDLDAGLVVVDGHHAPGVREAADERGTKVLDLAEQETGAHSPTAPDAGPGSRTATDIALILHTSGTTSRPKQVPLTHRNLLASARNVSTTLDLQPDDRCANVMPLFHIHGLVACLLASTYVGSSVVCTSGFDPSTFLHDVARHRCTWYSAVPTIHQAVVRAASDDADAAAACDLRFIRSSSSSLPPSVMDRLEHQFGVPVIEAYGMTEAAHQMTSNQLPPGSRRPGSVGIASGPEVSVADAAGEHLPTGSVGELVIRGENVMGGYLTPLEANDDAFFDGWFRTGDQGTIDADGTVTITGRLKELINRAGEKIAPREIDEALLADPEVNEALAFAIPHPTLGEDVSAVVVPSDPGAFHADGVLERLRTRLAEHKIPRGLIVVEELPKGATGKPARIGLAERFGLGTPTSTGPTDFDDPLVAASAAVMATVLETAPLGPDDDFVAVGGDSLRALATTIAIEDTFGVVVPAGMLLDAASTPRKLAEVIRAERRQATPLGEGGEQVSSGTRRLWTLQQIEPRSTAYNVAIALRIRGHELARVEEAVSALVARHNALRTTLVWESGALHRRVSADAGTAGDRRPVSPDEIEGFVNEMLDRPVDLGAEPVRVGIGTIDDRDHVVVLVTHHALVDGPSRQVLRRDVGMLLDGQTLRPIAVSAPRAPSRRPESAEFWREELLDPPPPLDLGPASDPRRGVAHTELTVDGTDLTRLRELARTNGVTLFAVLLAAEAEVLRRICGEDDLVVAVPVTSRPPRDDSSVGMYIETVPVRLRLRGIDSVAGLLAEVRRSSAAALAHSDLPFDELLAIAGLERTSDSRPLAGTMCQLRPPDEPDNGRHDRSVEELPVVPADARFDLTVDFVDGGDTLRIMVEHDLATVDETVGEHHAARVARMLHGLVAAQALGEIDICSEREREQLRRLGEVTSEHEHEHDEGDPLATIDRLADSDPDATAIVDVDRRVSRSSLAARSRAFADAFAAAAAGPDRPVGIALARSTDAVAAMIGAWRVGAPYVTFDHDGPPTTRDRTMIDRASAAAVVATDGDWGVPRIDPVDVADDGTSRPAPPGEGLAWILGTSGSTGEPKLVPGSFEGLRNRLCWGRRVVPVNGPAAHRAPLVFVDHVAEIFEPILAGQPLVVIDEETVRDPRRLAARIEQTGVTRLLVVPTLMRMLLAGLPDESLFLSLETVITSGEPLPPDVAEAWMRRVPSARLVNVYGSTEVSADATAVELARDGPVTVGRPIDGFRVQVVTSVGRPSPPGRPGEIWIAGPGVMSGYLGGDAGGTVSADLDGETRTWFPTGDRGRFDADGQLVVLGRADRRLKVRGVRIDPSEVECVLRAQAGVADATVYVRDAVLCAALVARPGAELHAAVVREALVDELPPSHRPSRIAILADLPRTSTGKLDHRALPSAPPEHTESAPPSTPTERWLADRWQELIPDLHAVSVDDDFFEVGGQSLTAIELFRCIDEEQRVDLPLSVIFDAPSMRLLAAVIDEARHGRRERGDASIGELSPGADGSPTVLWCSSNPLVSLQKLRDDLGPDVRLIGLVPLGFNRGERPRTRVADIVEDHIAALRSYHLSEPLVVAGNSFGALVALELSKRLIADGVPVDLLMLGDPWPPGLRPVRGRRPLIGPRQGRRGGRPGRLREAKRTVRHPRRQWSRFAWEWRWQRTTRAKEIAAETLAWSAAPPIDTLLFTTDERRRMSGSQDLGWGELLAGRLDVVELDGIHTGLLAGERGEMIARELLRHLDDLESR